MKAKSHVVVGIAAAYLINPSINIPLKLTTVLSAAFGSLVPDLDHPKSILNQKILPLKKNKSTKVFIYSLFGSLVLYINYLNFRSMILNLIGVILIMIGISHHRGFTHSGIGVFIFFMTVNLFTKKYGFNYEGLSFMIGYISHLITDFFTDQGIELFYPLDRKNYKGPIRFSTGGSVEFLISIGAFIFIAYRFMLIYG